MTGLVARRTANAAGLGILLAAGGVPTRARAIPAFARQYHTACTTCHTAPPKLNVLGEAFRLNGYRLPETSALVKRVAGVPLGDDAWKELWPRAIWPGELPALPAVSLRIASDALARRANGKADGVSLRFPSELYLLAGASLGEGISVFVEAEWSPGEGLEVQQAKVEFQDPVPGIPRRALNLWVGRQNPYLFTFAHQQIDRAGQQLFEWQEYRVSDLRLTDPVNARTLVSTNTLLIHESEPGIEVNGLLGPRAYYAVGVVQPETDPGQDGRARTAAYYKVRYKGGGMRLDGRYDGRDGPLAEGYGQLLDRAVIVEHFLFAGATDLAGGAVDHHRSLGTNVRVLNGRFDIGAGHLVRRDDDPWAAGVASEMTSVFGKAEYLPLPWVIGSLKVEQFRVRSLGAERLGYSQGAEDHVRFSPGIIALIRQNVRFVAEGELYAVGRSSGSVARTPTSALWMRLDVAF